MKTRVKVSINDLIVSVGNRWSSNINRALERSPRVLTVREYVNLHNLLLKLNAEWVPKRKMSFFTALFMIERDAKDDKKEDKFETFQGKPTNESVQYYLIFF